MRSREPDAVDAGDLRGVEDEFGEIGRAMADSAAVRVHVLAEEVDLTHALAA